MYHLVDSSHHNVFRYTRQSEKGWVDSTILNNSHRHKLFGRVGEGWSKDVIDGLQAAMKAANVPVHAKYGVVSFDEVKCKEGLAFDPHSLELIGWLLLVKGFTLLNLSGKLANFILATFTISYFIY